MLPGNELYFRFVGAVSTSIVHITSVSKHHGVYN